MERVWALAYLKGSNHLAFAYDEGTISISLGRDEPSISMDNTGKIIYAKHNEILSANLKTSVGDEEPKDGEKIALSTKDLGNSEIFPVGLCFLKDCSYIVATTPTLTKWSVCRRLRRRRIRHLYRACLA